MRYTVVGLHPDELSSLGPDDASFVEWVDADDPEEAVSKARAVDEDRIDAAIIAVFTEHLVDVLYNKGLASDEETEGG